MSGVKKGDTVKYIRVIDTTANDSDKTLDLSEAGQYDVQLMHLHVALTTTATAGNRLLLLTILDADGNEVGHVHPGSYQAASLTYHYYFLPGIFRETVSAVAETGVNGTMEVPIPMETVIPYGWSLVVKDANAIDAAADDMVVRAMFKVIR